jgi:hypothetical protein
MHYLVTAGVYVYGEFLRNVDFHRITRRCIQQDTNHEILYVFGITGYLD